MKKIFLLLVLTLSTSMLFGAYNIKLGVFKNGKNLRANIAKITPYTLRKQIIVKKRKNKLYYTYAIIEGSASKAKKALKSYRRIFKDAYIRGKVKSKRAVKKPRKTLKHKKKKLVKKRVIKKRVVKKLLVQKRELRVKKAKDVLQKRVVQKKIASQKEPIKKVLAKKAVAKKVTKVLIAAPLLKTPQELNVTDVNESKKPVAEVNASVKVPAVTKSDVNSSVIAESKETNTSKKLVSQKVPTKIVAIKKEVAKKSVTKKVTKVLIAAPLLKTPQELNVTDVNESKKIVAEVNASVKVPVETNASKSVDKNITEEEMQGQITQLIKDVNKSAKKTNDIIENMQKIASELLNEYYPIAQVDAMALLQHKSIYFCYEDGPDHLKKRVVKMTFNEKTITYMALDNEATLEIPYVMENSKIMLNLSDMQMVHNVLLNKGEYLLVTSVIDDKKMYTLRYYFDEKNALKYINEY